MKLVFATNNRHKIHEINSLIHGKIQILSLKEIGCFDEIEETENTLEGNAKLKANYITNNFGFYCFADDTGLEVDALSGAPGVFSARYAGENVTYDDNVNKMLLELHGVANRKAKFRTVIALNLGKDNFLFEGVCKGEILSSKHGQSGFGYDPIFKPDGFNKSFAEMTMEEKGKISHRGIAVQKLIRFLMER